jgi:hypothetical protein
MLELLLSIIITFGPGLSGNFGECPAASDSDTAVAIVVNTADTAAQA